MMTRKLLYAALLNGGLPDSITRYDTINGMQWGTLEKIGGVILNPLDGRMGTRIRKKRGVEDKTEEIPSQLVRTIFFRYIRNLISLTFSILC